MNTTDPKKTPVLLHIKINQDLARQLDEAARRGLTTRSGVVRRAALEFLRREQGEQRKGAADGR